MQLSEQWQLILAQWLRHRTVNVEDTRMSKGGDLGISKGGNSKGGRWGCQKVGCQKMEMSKGGRWRCQKVGCQKVGMSKRMGMSKGADVKKVGGGDVKRWRCQGADELQRMSSLAVSVNRLQAENLRRGKTHTDCTPNAEFQFQWVEFKRLGQRLFCAEEDSEVTPGVTDPLSQQLVPNRGTDPSKLAWAPSKTDGAWQRAAERQASSMENKTLHALASSALKSVYLETGLFSGEQNTTHTSLFSQAIILIKRTEKGLFSLIM